MCVFRHRSHEPSKKINKLNKHLELGSQEQVVTGMQWPPAIFVAWERTLASLVAAAWSTSGTPGILPSTHLGIVYTTYVW